MTSYQAIRECKSLTRQVRDVEYHISHWPSHATEPARTVLMLHGWMDIGQSFQFVADALPADWAIYAPDWRGFGGSENSGADSYWFADYLGDLDGLVHALFDDQPVDLVGHSMGGNVATLYAGVRPDRVRRLVNLEGMGLKQTAPEQAPGRLARWLDELREPRRLSDYDDLQAVVARLMKTNERLPPDKANFIAAHWAEREANGRYTLRADPQHKQVNPYLYRLDETLACWAQIAAPVLWVVSEHLNDWHGFIKTQAYQERLAVIKNLQHATVAGAGHMMHHDQPAAVAQLIKDFLQ